MSGCSSGRRYTRRQTITHRNPSSPGIMNATPNPPMSQIKNRRHRLRQSTTRYRRKRSASPRSAFWNHSETACSPPASSRTPPRPAKTETARSSGAVRQRGQQRNAEYHATLIVRPRLVPLDPQKRPATSVRWNTPRETASRCGVVHVRPVKVSAFR